MSKMARPAPSLAVLRGTNSLGKMARPAAKREGSRSDDDRFAERDGKPGATRGALDRPLRRLRRLHPSEMARPAPYRWCLRPAVGSRYTERDGKAGAVDGLVVAARARLRALGPKGGTRRHGYQPAG